MSVQTTSIQPSLPAFSQKKSKLQNIDVASGVEPKTSTTQLVGNLAFNTLVPSIFAYASRDRHMEITVPLIAFSIIPWAIHDLHKLRSRLCNPQPCISEKPVKKDKGLLGSLMTKDAFLTTASTIAGFYASYPVTDLFLEPRWLMGKEKPSSLVGDIIKDWNNNPSQHFTLQKAKDYSSYFLLSWLSYFALKDIIILPTIDKHIAPLFFKKESPEQDKTNG